MGSSRNNKGLVNVSLRNGIFSFHVESSSGPDLFKGPLGGETCADNAGKTRGGEELRAHARERCASETPRRSPCGEVRHCVLRLA